MIYNKAKHVNCKRGFTQLSKSWYAADSLRNSKYIDEITIGFYHKDGGTTGEFQVRWQKIGNRLVPGLIVFDDSWSALFNFKDMLESMANIDDENISPDEFCLILETLGIENITQIECKC